MAIETGGQNESGQTTLELESREERLERLFQMDAEIDSLEEDLIAAKASAKATVSGIEGNISLRKKERADLLFKLNNRQETVIPVATTTQPEHDETGDDIPSDAELEQFSDEAQASAKGEMETNPEADTAEGESSDTAQDAEQPGATSTDSVEDATQTDAGEPAENADANASVGASTGDLPEDSEVGFHDVGSLD